MKLKLLSFVLFCIPLMLLSQKTETPNVATQCYSEVVSFQINWNYDRAGGSRNSGGLLLKLRNNDSALLSSTSIEQLNFWLKILDQDPTNGKVYYLKKSPTEGVLLGNVLSPPGTVCL